jgi:hypothetical protein
MNWSAHQRRLLDALGYELLVPGRVGAAPMAVAAAGVRDAPANEDVAPAMRDARAPGSPLLDALRRAAGGADPLPLAGDLAALRRDPAAKRALWPRLRALRKGAA